MPYFAIENTDMTDGFIGIAFTFGYLPQEKQLQLAFTMGTLTMAIGFDFDVW